MNARCKAVLASSAYRTPPDQHSKRRQLDFGTSIAIDLQLPLLSSGAIGTTYRLHVRNTNRRARLIRKMPFSRLIYIAILSTPSCKLFGMAYAID